MNFVKRLTILIFAIFLCLPPLSVFAAKVPPLDTSDVLDDLKGLKLGEDAFDEANYPIQNDAPPELLGIYEYGWGSDLYALYAYVYVPDIANPACNYTSTFSGTYYGRLCAWANSFDDQGIELKLEVGNLAETVDKSDDGRFVKIKIDPSGLAQYLHGSESRIYSVGIVSWYYKQSDNPNDKGQYVQELRDFEVGGGGYYTFNSTGTATYQTGETIELKVNPSMYKTDFSPQGDYWHQMIYTAYFTIPKKYVEEFDALVGIEATWDERHTAPLVVTEDDELLSALNTITSDSNFKNNLLTGNVDTNHGAVISEYWVDSYNGTPVAVVGNKTINAMGLNDTPRSDLFYYDVPIFGGYTLDCRFNDRFLHFDTALKVADMTDFFIPTIGGDYDTDGDGVGDLSATFQESVDEGRQYGKNTYSFTCDDILSVDKRFNDNWIRSFFNSIWYPDSNDVEATLEPFYYLKDSDMTGYSRTKVNENLFIGERFWEDFYDTYAQAKAQGNQVVLFRFALRDYYSAPARYIDGETYSGYTDTANCALSYGTAFLDFDIIKLSFSKNAEIYEFNVDADPIDFVPGADAPNTPGIGAAVDNIWDKLVGIFQSIAKFIGGALVVIVIVVVVKWFLEWLSRRKND